MRYNVGSPMCKYRYIGYRNEGLIEYKYGETKMKCSICKRTRTAKHCLEDCICVKEQIDKCEQPLLKAINSRGMLDKIKFESFGFKFDFLSYTITMASNNTRFIGRDEISRKLKTKENKRFNKFVKNYRENHLNEIVDKKSLWETFNQSEKEIKIKRKIKNDWINIYNPYLIIIEEYIEILNYWYSKMEDTLKWIRSSRKDCYAIFPPLNFPHSVRE